MGFELLLSKGPGSPEVLPCSAWAICGVVGEHTHVCAQGHSVAGSGWAVFCVIAVFWASGKILKSHTYGFTGWVICGVVGEHKHVCSKACDAHDVAAVARFLVLGCCFCCCCCSSVWVVNCPKQGPR